MELNFSISFYNSMVSRDIWDKRLSQYFIISRALGEGYLGNFDILLREVFIPHIPQKACNYLCRFESV